MKLVSYAGQQLLTTDDVADALVELAAAIARDGETEALQIPVVVNGVKGSADLLVGVGNDLLVGPQASDGADPDFSQDAARMRSHRLYPRSRPEPDDGDEFDGSLGAGFDPEY